MFVGVHGKGDLTLRQLWVNYTLILLKIELNICSASCAAQSVHSTQ